MTATKPFVTNFDEAWKEFLSHPTTADEHLSDPTKVAIACVKCT